jgi:Mpv17 / PMP22 family
MPAVPILSAANAKITENLGSVLITNYYFWPLTNWISFTFCPVQLRVLLNNIVGVLWNAFLCAKMAA